MPACRCRYLYIAVFYLIILPCGSESETHIQWRPSLESLFLEVSDGFALCWFFLSQILIYHFWLLILNILSYHNSTSTFLTEFDKKQPFFNPVFSLSTVSALSWPRLQGEHEIPENWSPLFLFVPFIYSPKSFFLRLRWTYVNRMVKRNLLPSRLL